ncbi:MSMEG_4193 family putative phosphomutase [Tessaracoccus flavescens]|uniref:Phosphoglycerate mutase n=1 Tax=Tessaracoccus flavescens TaxID=399497 RepID=A0A1Q2D0V4_9ACTN|nr:MSMEG_4193 family putative phosphomutase [Tessaracoccus flavescens]AQP51894.1 hypothetical protein BW733_14745 [Tessaracoccus flavescens]
MTKVVLIRHGRSTANAQGILAGRAPGISLDDVGRRQAGRLGELFAEVQIAAAYTSPIQRCRETAELAGFPDAEPVDDITECDYGTWTGAKLESLHTEEVWGDIQAAPSRVSFPEGESMMEMFQRTTAMVRELAARHAETETVLVFSHGDPIKAVLADAFGMRLDDFQRIHVSPAGISIIDYRGDRPFVMCVNAGDDPTSMLASLTGPAVGGGDVSKPA